MLMIAIDLLPQAVERGFLEISYPLVAPFYLAAGAGVPSAGFEWMSVFAFLTYALVGWLLSEIIRSNIVSSPAEEHGG